MEKEGKYTKILRIRIDPELLEQVKAEVKRLDTDMSTYARWCLQTGLYFKDLNSFLRATSREDKEIKPKNK